MKTVENWLRGMKQGLQAFPTNYKKIANRAGELGFLGVLRAIYADLFVGRSLFQWAYLLLLSSVPILLEYTNGAATRDWPGLFTAWTGIVCVIMVAEGRASNYFFGFVSNLTYFVLSYENMFYGEVMTAVFFILMQPIGLYFWLAARVNGLAEKQSQQAVFETRKLDGWGWLKWLGFTALVWGSFGLFYQSIGSARPFRDSITDGTNWTGQFLMTYLYREQWLFWIATNLFSIYLWWGTSIHIQGMYWVYTVNSLVGWYQWSKAVKEGQVAQAS